MKITYSQNNLAETIRAKRIIQDMIRRGFALVVEVEREGVTKYERVQEFDAERGEYIIADFDSIEASRADELTVGSATFEERHSAPPVDLNACACGRPKGHRGACRGPRKQKMRLPMETTKATGIGRSAGG